MSGAAEPNEDGTVCCICRKPIVPLVDAVHGLYHGVEARHYECSAGPLYNSAKARFDEAHERAKIALDRLRKALDKRG